MARTRFKPPVYAKTQNDMMDKAKKYPKPRRFFYLTRKGWEEMVFSIIAQHDMNNFYETNADYKRIVDFELYNGIFKVKIGEHIAYANILSNKECQTERGKALREEANQRILGNNKEFKARTFKELINKVFNDRIDNVTENIFDYIRILERTIKDLMEEEIRHFEETGEYDDDKLVMLEWCMMKCWNADYQIDGVHSEYMFWHRDDWSYVWSITDEQKENQFFQEATYDDLRVLGYIRPRAYLKMINNGLGSRFIETARAEGLDGVNRILSEIGGKLVEYIVNGGYRLKAGA